MSTNLHIYAKYTKQPQKLTGDELSFMRAKSNHFISSGDLQKTNVGRTMSLLLDHIDYMTLEAMKIEPLSIENEEAKETVSRKTQSRAKRS